MAFDWIGVGVENCSFIMACCSLGSSPKALNAVLSYSVSAGGVDTAPGMSSTASLRFILALECKICDYGKVSSPELLRS